MEKYYEEYAETFNGRPEVVSWINTTLSNYLKKNQPTQGEVEHILDYLLSDDSPKRLERMSYGEALSNTEQWNRRQQKLGSDIQELPEDTEIALDFGDGFKIVKLIGENAYKREGFLMGHCVASYYEKEAEIYSLRDSKNKPHCTIERDRQIKGKGNGDIHPKYIDYVVKFLEHIGMKVSDHEMLHLGYINTEGFKEYFGKETKAKLYGGKYLQKNERMINKEGNEFSTLELLDHVPFINSLLGEFRFDLNLSTFVPLAVNFLGEVVERSEQDNGDDSLQIISRDDYARISNIYDYARISDSGYAEQISNSGKHVKIGNSGVHARIGNSGDRAQIGNSCKYARIANSGHRVKIGNTGSDGRISNSGGYAQIVSAATYVDIGNSGGHAQIGNSGDRAQIGNSGNYVQIGNSGDYVKISNSGSFADIGNSGDHAKISNSGVFARINSSGKHAVLSAIGNNAMVRGKKGSWIVLAEYDISGVIKNVVSRKVTGRAIKEDTWYTLKDGKFTEVNWLNL